MIVVRIILAMIGIVLALLGILIIVAAFNNLNVASNLVGHATFYILLSIPCFWFSVKARQKN
jgi:uncharacterized membrane protein YqjE